MGSRFFLNCNPQDDLAAAVAEPAHGPQTVEDGVAPVTLRRRIARGRCAQHSAPQARIDRPVDKRRASHPLPQAAFKLASLLRHPGLAQAFVLPFESFEGARIGDPLWGWRIVRLQRRDRPELCAGRHRKVMLQRFTGLRFMTGQSQRRSEESYVETGCWSQSRSPGVPSRSPDRTASARNRTTISQNT